MYSSDAKIKEGIFVGPEIRKLIQDEKFEKIMNKTEENAWKSFLGNSKSPGCKKI